MLLSPFRKLADRFLKAVLEVFGGSPDVGPRVQAFLSVRALALAVPNPYMERCLKVGQSSSAIGIGGKKTSGGLKSTDQSLWFKALG